MLAATNNLTNVRASSHDAVEVLREQIAPGSLDEVLVLFPDPWHKKRHHKRRLIQPPFVELIASRLRARRSFQTSYRLGTLRGADAGSAVRREGTVRAISRPPATGCRVPRNARPRASRSAARGWVTASGTWRSSVVSLGDRRAEIDLDETARDLRSAAGAGAPLQSGPHFGRMPGRFPFLQQPPLDLPRRPTCIAKQRPFARARRRRHREAASYSASGISWLREERGDFFFAASTDVSSASASITSPELPSDRQIGTCQ